MKCDVLSPYLPTLPTSVAFSRRSQTVFVASPLLAFPTNKCISESTPSVSYRGPADCLRLSRDERNLGVTAHGVIKFIDLNTGREIRNLPAHSLAVKSLCPRRNSIYSWISGSLDSTWVMWDTRCHPANILSGHAGGPIRCLEVSPDDALLAVGTDSSLQLYDLRNRSILRRFGVSTCGVQFNPSQMLLASYGSERTVRFWCLDQLECVSESDPLAEDICGISFAGDRPENDFLLTATDRELTIMTWEPYDTLARCTLLQGYKTIDAAIIEDKIEMVSYGIHDSSLAVFNYTVEEVLLSGSISEPDTAAASILESCSPSSSCSSTTGSPARPSSALSPSDTSSSISDMEAQIIIPVAPIVKEERPPARKTVAAMPRPPKVPPKARTKSVTTRTAATLSSRSNSDNNLAGKRVAATRSQSSRPTSPSENDIPSLERKPRPSTLPVNRNKTNLKERSVSPRIITKKPTANETPKSSTEKSKKNMSDFDILMSEAKKGNAKIMMKMKAIRGETAKLKKVIGSKGRDAAQPELLFCNMAIVANLITRFNERHEWTVRHAASLLPRVIEMLDSAAHRKTSLDSLEELSVHMVPVLSSILSGQISGVDVEADARRKSAELCAKEIRQLVKARNLYFKKMDEDTAFRLDSILEALKKV